MRGSCGDHRRCGREGQVVSPTVLGEGELVTWGGGCSGGSALLPSCPGEGYRDGVILDKPCGHRDGPWPWLSLFSSPQEGK